jgi:hypothetical protein
MICPRDGCRQEIPDDSRFCDQCGSRIYWYEKDPDLLEAEKEAMRRLFPEFQLEKLEDGRFCWSGQVNPRGADGGVWILQAVYDHDHPHNKRHGGSVHVYSIKPDLDELFEVADGEIPHVLRDEYGHFYMSIQRLEDVDVREGYTSIFSAVKSIGRAAIWIFWFESWLNGEVDEDYIGGNYG